MSEIAAASSSDSHGHGAVALPKAKSHDDDHDPNAHEEKKEVFDAELLALLQTDPLQGLNDAEVQERLANFGLNEIAEVKTNPFLKFLSYFTGAIAFLIEAACILAAVLEDWLDFGIILGLLIVNAVIGFLEESKAENALEALRSTLALRTKAVRNGKFVDVESNTLVPGDVVVLSYGNIVPADCILLGLGPGGEPASALQIDQAALTGESLPVEKSKDATAYSSSIVKVGAQLGIVAKTGERTFVGRAASLMAITNEEGHFQKIIKNIGNFLIAITIFMVAILLIVSAARGQNFLEALTYALVLTIASIPVGLPTVMSVTMAVGAKQLAAKKCIIKRLPAVEEMASLSILCSDKTGTLTQNKLSLDKPFLATGFSFDDLLFYAYAASDAGANDAIEIAVRTYGVSLIPARVGGDRSSRHIPGFKGLAFEPFNPHTKMTSAQLEDEKAGVTWNVAKGAPHVIINLVRKNTKNPEMIAICDAAHHAVNEFAKTGLRALGVARTLDNTTDDWVLVGMLSLLDPPREDSAETIRRCNAMGVDVKMVTGDQLVIAKEVAKRLGMNRAILHADKLSSHALEEEMHKLEGEKVLSEDEKKKLKEKCELVLSDRCFKCDGFAQVIPEDKFRVVELLQKRGLVIGMTGDGVNDAPALKKADVGIAVYPCTDAARSAADVVLLEEGLKTIVDGLMTSRAIFQRMRSYALYRITSTVHFLFFFFWTILLLNYSLPPKLIVLICLLNDAATLVISVDNAAISPRPDKWRLGQLMFMSCVLGLMLTAASFAHFFIARDVFNVSLDELDTIIYLQVSSCPHFVIFGTRLAGPWYTNPPSLVFFIAIVGTQIFAMFISIYGAIAHPVGWGWGAAVMAISWAYFMLMDAVKVYVFKKWNFELTVKLAPLPSRRALLASRQVDTARKARVKALVRKMRVYSHMIWALSAMQKKMPKTTAPVSEVAQNFDKVFKNLHAAERKHVESTLKNSKKMHVQVRRSADVVRRSVEVLASAAGDIRRSLERRNHSASKKGVSVSNVVANVV